MTIISTTVGMNPLEKNGGGVMVEISDKMWSPGEVNGKPLQYSCLENPMNSMKRQNDRILKEEPPQSVGAKYAKDTVPFPLSLSEA